jgi:hypothetical protein
MADAEGSAATVLDQLMPTFQAAERHAATIAASADHVWAALTQVTVGELGLFRVLMGVRVLPGRLVRSPRARFDADEPLLGWAVRFGFSILGEDVRRELVVGAIGQPWRLAGGRSMAVAGGQDFAAFDQAGHAKMAANFRLAPIAGARAIQLSTGTPAGLHRCRLGPSLCPLLVVDPPGQRGDPSQLAGGDQALRRTICRRRRQPPVGAGSGPPLRSRLRPSFFPGSRDMEADARPWGCG